MTVYLVLPNSNTSNNIYSFSEAFYLSGFLKKGGLHISTLLIDKNDIEKFELLNEKNVLLISMWDGIELVDWFKNLNKYSSPQKVVLFGITAQIYGSYIKNFCNFHLNIINSNKYHDVYREFTKKSYVDDDCDELSHLDISLMQISSLPIIPIISSRGCPNSCSFCAINCSCEPHQEYFIRPCQDVYNDLKTWSEFGKTIFYFVDSCFLTKDKNNLQRIKNLCELIISNKLEISFFIETRVDSIDKDILLLLKKAGLRRVLLGVENFNSNVLNRYNKNIKIPQIYAAIETLQKLNINIDITLIMFDQLTTKQELIDNLNAIIANKIYKFTDITGIFRRLILIPKHKIRDINTTIIYEKNKISFPDCIEYSYNYEIFDPDVKHLEKIINQAIIKFKQKQSKAMSKTLSLKSKIDFKEITTRDFLIIINNMIKNDDYYIDNYLDNEIEKYFNEMEK